MVLKKIFKVKLLYLYITRNNLYYLFFCLTSCIFIYLLIDLFDRLDNFLNKSTPFDIIVSYFLWKIPVIISQIFPMVFFLTFIIQFSLMKKNREWEALEGGGIFWGNIVIFIFIYSIMFSFLQMFFSQYLGIQAQIKTEFIWDNLGKRNTKQKQTIKNFWFRKEEYIGHINYLNIKNHMAEKVSIYKMDRDFTKIKMAIYAKRAKISNEYIKFINATICNPEKFRIKHQQFLKLHIKNIDSIFEMTLSQKLEDVPLWKLKGIIRELKQTGTNVEEILTVWYGKIAYSFSIVCLTLFAIILTRKSKNLPLNLAVGLCVSFVFYGLFVFGSILGKHGVLPPFIGAWGGNFIFGSVALYYLFIARN